MWSAEGTLETELGERRGGGESGDVRVAGDEYQLELGRTTK